MATTVELRDAVREALALAADVVDAPRVIMLWDPPEEPGRLAWWARREFGMSSDPSAICATVVTEALAAYDFLCEDARRADAEVVYFDGQIAARRSGPPIESAFGERFGIGAVLSTRVGESGRLFFLDRGRLSSDDLNLARIVGHHVMAVVEHALLVERSQDTAASNERARLARDLHDGLVQSLAALAFQLEAAGAQVDEATRASFGRIQSRLREEQARLRLFVANLRPLSFSAATGAPGLAGQLQQAALRLGHDWRVQVTFSADGAGDLDAACGSLADDLCFIVHEAVSNAARHGGASRVEIRLARDDGSVRVTVEDNGRGFQFCGRYEDEKLRALGRGPASLHDRVTLLGGQLTVDSRPSGARLDIQLPLGRR